MGEMPWWYPWIRAAKYMRGAVDLFDLINMPLGPVWRDRILIAEAAEDQAQQIVAARHRQK